MALMKCPECGHEISDKAEACPNCGYKVSAEVEKKSLGTKEIIYLLAVAAVFIFLFSNSNSTNKTPAMHMDNDKQQKELALQKVKFNFTWKKEENFMTANFDMKNDNEFYIKDILILCNCYSPSGTKVSSTSRTIYETIPPNATIKVQNFNMGLIHAQTGSVGCQLIDIVY